MFKALGAWLSGYLLMWLSKLLLTDIFTNFSAFKETFEVTAVRLGTGGLRANDTSGVYDSLRALTLCLKNLCSPFLAVIAVCGLLLWIFALLRKRDCFIKKLKENSVYLIVALIPVIWIMIGSQPSAIHHFFQYRTLGVSVFALICFLINTAAEPLAS